MIESCFRLFGHGWRSRRPAVVGISIGWYMRRNKIMSWTIKKDIDLNGLQLDMNCDRILWGCLIYILIPPGGIRLFSLFLYGCCYRFNRRYNVIALLQCICIGVSMSVILLNINQCLVFCILILFYFLCNGILHASKLNIRLHIFPIAVDSE